jgi:hypothetical protein
MKTAKTAAKGKSRFHSTPPESKRIEMGKGNTTVVIPMDPAKRWPGMYNRLVIEAGQLYLGNPDPTDEFYDIAFPVTLIQAIAWLGACNAIERTDGTAEMALLKWASSRLGEQGARKP